MNNIFPDTNLHDIAPNYYVLKFKLDNGDACNTSAQVIDSSLSTVRNKHNGNYAIG